ncbi:hypothetical protein P7C70_g4593, partial [Phenoliferia sp. Uapishka_3]
MVGKERIVLTQGWSRKVVIVLAISNAHTGILCYALYGYLVTNFGNQDNVTKAEWEMVAHIAIFTFIAFFAQIFYAARIATLFTGNKLKLLVAAISVLSLAQLAAYSTSKLSSTEDVFKLSLKDNVAWQTMAGLLCSVICNFIICSGMVVDMRSGRFATRKEGIWEVLSRLVVETNLLTALCSLLNLIFFFVYKRNGVSVVGTGHFTSRESVNPNSSSPLQAFAIVIPKLYLLSLFSNLARNEEPMGGISSVRMRHESSLSDMFKGKPMSSYGHSQPMIGMGMGVPARPDSFDPPPPGSPTWRRSPLSQPDRVNKSDDSASVSDYGGFSTSVYLKTPTVYGESHFSRQREGSPIFVGEATHHDMPTHNVGFAVSSDDGHASDNKWHLPAKNYGFI